MNMTSKNGGNSGNDGKPGHEETCGPGGGSDINQESIVEARIIKSVNEKRDKEILAKIKSFHDLKDKRRATEEKGKKIQLALEQVGAGVYILPFISILVFIKNCHF